MYLQGSTQWDSLAHVGYDGKFYNDADTSTVTAHGGAAREVDGEFIPFHQVAIRDLGLTLSEIFTFLEELKLSIYLKATTVKGVL